MNALRPRHAARHPAPLRLPARFGGRRLGRAVAALALAATVAACSSGAGGSDESSGASSEPAVSDGAAGTGEVGTDLPAARGGQAASATGVGSRAKSVLDIDAGALAGRDVIRTGSMSVVTENLGAARNQVAALMDQLGGVIASESTSIRPAPVGAEEQRSMQLGLQVPTERFDATLEALAGLGAVRARVIQTEDVTAQVADVNSRVDSARAALDRVRALLARANSLGTVIQLEGVLSDRQADLEALIAQQRALEGQTQLASVQLELRTPGESQPPPSQDKDWQGFVAGLADGWDALRALLLGISTTIGVLLPFAAVAGLLALPLLVWRRRRGATPSGPLM